MDTKIAIIGGGNGAISMAADLTYKGYRTSIWVFPEFWRANLQPVRERGGIQVRGVFDAFVPIVPEQLPESLEEAVAGARIVMIVVPAFAHERVASALAPLLQPQQVVLLSPSTGGALEFRAVLERKGYRSNIVAESQTLIYTCRLNGPSDVSIFFIKRSLPVSVLPQAALPGVIAELQEIYPQIVPASSVLETSLNNLNPVAHVAPTLLNTGAIEARRGDFYFYREGISPSVGAVMDTMDNERIALCRSAGVPSLSLLEFMKEMYGVEGGSAFEVFSTSDAHRSTKAPDSLSHRYITEDISYGLIPMLALAEVFGIAMPVSLQMVRLAELLTGRDFGKEGRNIDRLGLTGASAASLREMELIK